MHLNWGMFSATDMTGLICVDFCSSLFQPYIRFRVGLDDLQSSLLPDSLRLVLVQTIPAASRPHRSFHECLPIQPAMSGLRAVSENCLFPPTTLHSQCSHLVPRTHCSFPSFSHSSLLTEGIITLEAECVLLSFKAAVEPGEDRGWAGALSSRLSLFPPYGFARGWKD